MVEAHALRTVARAGMIGFEPPARGVRIIRAINHYGTIGGAIAGAALKHGERTALVDELGALSFADLDRRSNALANAWRGLGAGAGTGVGILCRNHRGFLDATFATAKIGGRAVYLNTDFAGPQLREVCEREGVELLVHDEEFAAIVEPIEARRGRFGAWSEADAGGNGGAVGGGEPRLEELIATGDPAPPPAPSQRAGVIMLTSGTTGTPKGAPREQGRSLAPVGAWLSMVPFRSEEATFIAAPMFHALGFAHSIIAAGLGSTVVTRRRFDPEATLAGIAEHRCTALIVVPVMLQRILALDPGVRERHDASSLRIIFCAGAQLEADVATRSLDVFGDVLYNFYGSTEVAYATIAKPEDLRAAPGCAGKPPFGTTVKILDEQGRELPQGRTGRIFVANTFQFEGYTGGGGKEVVNGLMSSGDVGHFDFGGRLFVDGRDDEMIVSGGENVFPREVEELLITHEAIEEAAAIGVPDPDLGQRLRAFVALRPGAELGEQEVKQFVKSNLARFKVPRDVTFVERLPRNPTGKVLKRELAAAAETRADGPKQAAAGDAQTEPAAKR